MKNTTKIIIDSLLVIPISVFAYFLILGIRTGNLTSFPVVISFYVLVRSFYISVPALFASSFAIIYLWRRFGPAKFSWTVSMLLAVTINALVLYFYTLNAFTQW